MADTNRNLHSLIYSSLADPQTDNDSMQALLRNSRFNNKRQNITGLLLFHKGAFLQVLEGDRRVICNLFEKKLMRDTRHKSVTLFHDEQITTRRFRHWHLAYSDLKEPAPMVSASYTELLKQGRSLFELTNNTQTALDLVRQIHRRVLSRPSQQSTQDRKEN